MWPLQSNVGSGQPCRLTGEISLPHGTDIDALLDAALASGATVIEISERVVFTTSRTIPAGVILWFKSGGRFAISTGAVITCLGTVIAPLRQLFYGGGTFIGLKFNRPEWWGAKRDGATSDAPAINFAFASANGSFVSDGDEVVVAFNSGVYAVGSQISSFPTNNHPLRIKGAGKTAGGTRFLNLATAPSGAGTTCFAIRGEPVGSSAIVDFDMGGFSIISQTPGQGAQIALRIGDDSAATDLIGVGYSYLRDVYIENFAIGIDLINVRLIKFDRVDVWETSMVAAATAINMAINGASNCGDFIFTACNFVMPDTTSIAPIANQYCMCATVGGGDYSSATGAYSISGIKCYACNMYGGDQTVRIYVQDGARAAEFYFGLMCQWDQTANRRVYLESNKNGASTPVIETVKIESCWMSESLLGCIVASATGGAGIIRGLTVTDTEINLSQAEALNLAGAAGAIKNTTFSRNRLYDANAHNGGATGKVLDLGLSYDTTCVENTFANTVTANFYNIAISISLGNVGATVYGNNTRASPPTAAIVSDLSGAVTKNIGTNI